MERPIGIIDSGVGGLTVTNEIIKQLPRENIIYLGDTERCPYGSKTENQIKKFTWDMVNFLLEKNIKALVIACNTATAYTLEDLEKELDIPVIGVINPGAITALESTQNYNIGILGTDGTIRSQAYTKALHHLCPKVNVTSLACPSFVPMIEQGILSGPKLKDEVKQTLLPLQQQNKCDTLVLGCTHYPLIKDTIQDVMGSEIKLVSSGEATARVAKSVLKKYGIDNKTDKIPTYNFYTTGDLKLFTKTAQILFQDFTGHVMSVMIDRVSLY